MTEQSPPIPLGIRRLLKKIEEAPADQFKVLFKELPRAGEDLALFQAVLGLSVRVEVLPHVFEYISWIDAERCDEAHFAAVVSWANEFAGGFDRELFLKYTGWILRRVYKASDISPGNPNTLALVRGLSAWFAAEPEKALVYFKSENWVFDLWIASLMAEERGKIAVRAIEIPESSLTEFFKLLADQHSHDRGRGGDLPDRPWLAMMREVWTAAKGTPDKVARCFIPGWRSRNSDDTGIADLMCELLDTAEEPLRSHMKAAMYSYIVPFTQYLAKKNAKPVFDPVVCFVVANTAAPDELYGATKWAMDMADPAKLPIMVDVVAAFIAGTKSSVLRRFPAFFLMAGQLHIMWDHDESPEVAEAMKRLARYWTSCREQFQREADAEGQTHYFSSNAEEVEKHMGKVLVRTQT